jgi:hypothetical protein
MTFKPSLANFLWMTAGALLLLAIMLLVIHFHQPQDPAAKLALQAKKLDLVSRINLALTSAAEAEKSAVLAITDEDSKTYADQAGAATAQAERARQELVDVMKAASTDSEKPLLDQFSQRFTELQRIDAQVLDLAVRNSNIKAYALAYGPAAAAIKDMDAALSRLVAQYAPSTAPEARNPILLATGAQAAALRIQALLPPHIAEASNLKMDDLESQMALEDQRVRQDLSALTALPALAGNPDPAIASAAYDRFSDLRKQILALSRENTNVISLSLSLNQKRKAMFVCQDALNALAQAIRDEPITGPGMVSPR